MSKAVTTAREILSYTGINRLPASCVVCASGNTVVVKEIAANTGMSITNACEAIAAVVCDRYGIDPKNLELYEYYLVGGKKSLSKVSFCSSGQGSFSGPDWTSVDVCTFESDHFPLALLGEEDSYFAGIE